MGKVADEVCQGIRCAVCEERFESSDDVLYVGSNGEWVHRKCWE